MMNNDTLNTNEELTGNENAKELSTDLNKSDEPVKKQEPNDAFFAPITEYEPEPEFDDEIYDMDQVMQEDEYTSEQRTDMETRFSETMKIFRSGELVSGKVVAISDSDVSIDIGFKSEGIIPTEEFDNLRSLKVGDEVEVLIDNIEDRKGVLKLSKRKAEFTRVWENINGLYQTGEMVEAQIVRRIKGGMVVDLFGVEAFLPGSQIDVHPVRDFDALVSATMDFRIIKVNNARKNVVLSHKVLVEESLQEIRHRVLSELEEGQIVEGVVKNITDFGVFVDLGGVDGLLHITDLSWGRVSHPSDVVSLDEKIKVKVLRYDKEKQRISLGLKQLKEHHWDEIETKYTIDALVKGKVISLVKYGAFIELEEGVEGLVHISEMSWTQHIKHPSQIVSVGDEIDVRVLNIDRDNRKISLGIKQCDTDPWERLEQTYTVGTRHVGVVRDLVPFGAFVELEQNIDGLIHISDLSWVRRVRHPGEIVKKGQELEVIVLSFDRNERRIALGLKQLESDPWDNFEREYPIRARTEGSVVRVLEKGVVVMLPLGVEGFIPNSQLGRTLAGDNKRQIKDGDNMELEVIEFDKINHRIVLSHSVIERENEKNGYRSYSEGGEETKPTIGDIMREAGTDEIPEETVEMTNKKDTKSKTDDSSKKESRAEIEPVATEKTEPEPDIIPEVAVDDVKTESDVTENVEEAPTEAPKEKVEDASSTEIKDIEAEKVETAETPDEVKNEDTEINTTQKSPAKTKTSEEEGVASETEKKKSTDKVKKSTVKTGTKTTTAVKTTKPKKIPEKKDDNVEENTAEKTEE
jgi:small subunit ribosomal protein S1